MCAPCLLLKQWLQSFASHIVSHLFSCPPLPLPPLSSRRELLCLSPCRTSDGGCCCCPGRRRSNAEAAHREQQRSDVEAASAAAETPTSQQVPAGIFMQIGKDAGRPHPQPAAPHPDDHRRATVAGVYLQVGKNGAGPPTEPAALGAAALGAAAPPQPAAPGEAARTLKGAPHSLMPISTRDTLAEASFASASSDITASEIAASSSLT